MANTRILFHPMEERGLNPSTSRREMQGESLIHATNVSSIYLLRSGEELVVHKRYNKEYEHELAREVAVLRQLSHPNIPRLISAAESILELEFHGESLSSALQHTALETAEWPGLFSQLLDGLKYLHQCGWVHCDLKPSNITVMGRKLKIIDFASAVPVGSPSNGLRYTYSYAPLELLLGITTVDSSVDMWAAGLILYRILSGRDLLLSEGQLGAIRELTGIFGTPSCSDYDGLEFRHRLTLQQVDHGEIQLLDDESLNAFLLRFFTLDPRRRVTASDAWAQMCRFHDGP